MVPMGATLPARARRLDIPPGLLVVFSSLSVQVGASIASGLLTQFSPITVVAIRLVFGAVLVDLFRRPRIRGSGRQAWRSAFMLGVVLACMNASFYVALARIPLGVAVTISFVGPLAAALLGSRRPLDLVWVVLAAVGVVLLASPRFESADIVGLLAAGGAGLCWFLYILVAARVSRDWPDGSGVSASMTVSALLIMPFVLLIGDLGAVAAEPAVLLAGLGIALFSSALPYSLEVAALGRLRPETYGILVSLEPAFAAMAGFLLLSQTLEIPELVAVGLVSVASIGASLTARPIPETPGEPGV
jgi:inner membrane transporter RhtA